MTLLYDDPRFLNHQTLLCPENADRIRGLSERLRQTGLDSKCRRPEFKPAVRQQLARVHSATHIDEIWALAKSGGGDIEADTYVGPASYHVAMLAAGAVCDATERLVRGEDSNALCLVRPPGHHALASRAMGFCLFNNIAIAAKLALQELGLDRVLIVDWDIHHGNGTQATFWEDPQVGFLSVHRWPFYPGTGDSDEIGHGPGLGTTLNLPVEYGISRKDLLTVFSDRLTVFAEKIKPQLVLLSAGFDAHRLDPVGDLGLETEDYAPLTSAVLDIANAYAGGKLVSVLEGGYNPTILADCVEAHLSALVERSGQGSDD